jgi:hypothetical protein
VIDIHDSSFHGVVSEAKSVHKGNAHQILANVVTDPEFLKRSFTVAFDFPFVHGGESQFVVSGSHDTSIGVCLTSGSGEVWEKSIVDLGSEAVDLGPGVEKYIQGDPINGDGDTGSGVGFVESLRENIDSSV